MKGNKIGINFFIIPFFMVFVSCSEDSDNTKHTYVVITSNDMINGENKFTYQIEGTCRGRSKKVEVMLTDTSGNSVIPRISPVCNEKGKWITQVDTSELAEGNIIVTATHNDFINRSYFTNAKIFKDTIPINLTINSLGNILAKSEEHYGISGSCTEDGHNVIVYLKEKEGVNQTDSETIACSQSSWETAFDTRNLAQGDVSIIANHQDRNGDFLEKSVDIIKDIEIPVFEIQNVENITAALQNVYDLNGTCSENNEHVMIKLTDSKDIPLELSPVPQPRCELGLWSGSVNVATLKDGDITLTVTHGDKTGNVVSKIINIEKDVEVPFLTINNPQHIFPNTLMNYALDGVCSENDTNVSVSISDSGNNSMEITFAVPCLEGRWQATNLNVSELNSGEVTITVSQLDHFQNLGMASTTIRKNDSALAITVNSPSPINIKNNEGYSLGGGCVPDGGEINAEIGGNSPVNSPVCEGGIWSANFNLKDLSESNSILITVDYHYNGGENHAEQQRFTIMKDIESPSLTLNNLLEIDRIIDSSYNLSGSCSENDNIVEIVVGNISAQTDCENLTWEKSLDVSNLNEGAVIVGITHRDDANNSFVIEREVNRDNSVIIKIPESPHIDSSNKFNYDLSGQCSEEGSEVNVSIGGVSPNIHPTCNNFEWNIDDLNVSTLNDGIVDITVTHGNSTATTSVQSGCYSDGEEAGTEADPIIVCNYENLKNINNGRHKYYILGANIDASDSWSEGEASCAAYDGMTVPSENPCLGMSPIGRFTGTFNGDDFQINNLYMRKEDESVGLFSELGGSGTVKNLNLRNVMLINTSTPDNYPSVGGIAGIVGSEAIIESCSLTGKVSGLSDAGGLAGFFEGTILNSYVDATIEGAIVGVLVGYSYSGVITNSYARGVAKGNNSNDSIAGGLVATIKFDSVIRNSYADVNVEEANIMGGLVGESEDSRIFSCYATGEVEAGTGNVGGLVGNAAAVDANSAVSTSFWDSQETGQTNSAIGGSGLSTTQMKISCTLGGSNGVCALGTAFTFSANSYPKVKQCTSGCNEDLAIFSSNLLGGQTP